MTNFKYILFLLASLGLFSNSQGQHISLDVSGASTAGFFNANAGGVVQWGIGTRERFKIGPGVRLGYVNGRDLDYLTAPADLTTDDKNMDTLFMEGPKMVTLNLGLYMDFLLTERLGLGFNIDVSGVSLGGEKKGTFQPAENALAQNRTVVNDVKASPTTYNQLIMGDLDKGSLNSQFFFSFMFSDQMSVKGGLNFMFTEYTTDLKVGVDDNNRFRNKTAAPFFGVIYKLN